jgi:hypothetical protein
MDTENIRLRWEQEEAAVRQRIEAGGGKAGVARPEQIAGKTGLEIMQALLRGELPYPPISETLGFYLIEVGDGHAVFQGEPQFKHYNPLGTVHGGWTRRWVARCRPNCPPALATPRPNSA